MPSYTNAALKGCGSYTNAALKGLGASSLVGKKTTKGSAAAKAKMAYLRSLRGKGCRGAGVRGAGSKKATAIKKLMNAMENAPLKDPRKTTSKLFLERLKSL